MAVLPLAIPIATTLIGSGLNVGQAIGASKKRKEAEAAADAAAARLKAMRFEDAMAGLQVPMMGFEQAAQKQAQREAMQIQALQEAGGAAVLGGTPGLAAMGAEEELARMAQIDQMEYARNLELARNRQQLANMNLQMQANIEGMELGGAQQAAAQAESDKRAAISGMAQSIGQAGIDIYKTMPLYKAQEEAAKTAAAAATSVAAPKNTLTGKYASLDNINAPQYGIGATPTPSYSGALQVPQIGSKIQPHPMLNPFESPINKYTPSINPLNPVGETVNLLELPPSMGGKNLGAYNPFASFSSPFEQYTTF